jgi:hypothetical protein
MSNVIELKIIHSGMSHQEAAKAYADWVNAELTPIEWLMVRMTIASGGIVPSAAEVKARMARDREQAERAREAEAGLSDEQLRELYAEIYARTVAP